MLILRGCRRCSIRRLARGRGCGVAVYRSYGSWVAQIAEVAADGEAWRVERIVCAADCGTVVNPDAVAAQMEGAIVFALSAALHGEITLADGAVEQQSFEDYPILRMRDTPRIEVHLVPSREPPGGAGEPGVPPLAPAAPKMLPSASRIKTPPGWGRNLPCAVAASVTKKFGLPLARLASARLEAPMATAAHALPIATSKRNMLAPSSRSTAFT